MSFGNISMCFEKNWAKNAHWAISGNCDQMRGYKTPLFNFVCDFLESWPAHICFAYA